MTNRVKNRLWQALGGAIDDAGNPTSRSDWQEVFTGSSGDASKARAALRYEGLVATTTTHVPIRLDGSPEPERTVVWVRPSDGGRADALIESLAIIGYSPPAAAGDDISRPRGFAALVELASEAETDTAVRALRRARLSAVVTGPQVGLDDVGYVISVRFVDLFEASEIIRTIATTDTDEPFVPRDLADVPPPPDHGAPKGRGVRWLAWSFLAAVLGLTTFVLVAVGFGVLARSSPLALVWWIAGLGTGWGTWQAGRRSAQLDREP